MAARNHNKAVSRRAELTEEARQWITAELRHYPPYVSSEDIAFSYARLARIFSCCITQIAAGHRFHRELKASSDSLLRPSEIDKVYYDLEDLTEEFQPHLSILSEDCCTVKGYVCFMAQARVLCEKHGSELTDILMEV